MTDVKAIQDALEKATPGPWNTGPVTLAGSVWVYDSTWPIAEPVGLYEKVKRAIFRIRSDAAHELASYKLSHEEEQRQHWAQKERDAHLIANAPTWLSELLAENEKLREELAVLDAMD